MSSKQGEDSVPYPVGSWTLDVLTAVRSIGKPTFGLEDVYAFESEWQTKRPQNRTIKDTVRRELQRLRDDGFLTFNNNRGEYSLVNGKTQADSEVAGRVSLSSVAIEKWRAALQAARSESEWLRLVSDLKAQREPTIPGIVELVTRFLSGGTTLPDFTSEFHRRTGKEWAPWAVSGVTGAMFFNYLPKSLPEHHDASAEALRRAFVPPESLEQARSRIGEFIEYLEGHISSGTAPRNRLNPGSSPFPISFLWHAQRPQQWPIYYDSLQRALRADGLIGSSGYADRANDYAELAHAMQELSLGIGATFLELEELAKRLIASQAVGGSQQVPDASDSSDGSGDAQRGLLQLLGRSKTRAALLFGPAGTGKTWAAEVIAQTYRKHGGLVQWTQFHPAYAYEDFVVGIRPEWKAGGLVYAVRSGIFKEFCDRAREQPGPHLFVIDEINRGNIAKVLGELMYCLEYRVTFDDRPPTDHNVKPGWIRLPYGDSKSSEAGGNWFSVPENVHILGTMNSSDRSIAMLDVALRRRFLFVELKPDSSLLEGIEANELGIEGGVGGLMDALNDRIRKELGRHKLLGHSYFMPLGYQGPNNGGTWTLEDFKARWFHQILPLLEEYFADDAQALVDKIIGKGWGRVHDRRHFVPSAPDEVDFVSCLRWIVGTADDAESGPTDEASEDE